MKVMIILVLCGAAVFGVVKVLGSTLSPAEYQHTKTAVRGALGVSSVSVADQTVPVWKEPRPTSTLIERKKNYIDDLKQGETFVVLKHFQNGAPLWIRIRSQDRDLEGWIVSRPDDPFHATPAKR